MIWLAFDTETTGIDEPDLVELGAVLMEDDRERACVSLVVRPDGWNVPDEAARVHGITHATAVATGVPLIVAVAALTNLWGLAALRVAHNLEFDDKVIRRAIARLPRGSNLPVPPSACTKELATPVLNLPPTERMLAAGYNKPKPPTLTEAYRFFFGEPPTGAHSALADARACARVYLKLLEMGRA